MTNQLPEAPASVTYSLVSPNGFPILFTLRDNGGQDLLTKMLGLEKKLINGGFKAQDRNKSSYPKKEPNYIEGKTCPLCNEKLVLSSTRDGKQMEKCSTNKWDKLNHVATGCKYVKFL